MEKSESVANLIQFVVDSVRQAHADNAPFYHLQFDRIFPDDFYAQMVEAMPIAEDYRAMSGKSKMGSSRADGKPTRTKIDLFPEYIRHLRSKKRAVWDMAGSVLRSKELQSAFVQRLRPGLKLRFGEKLAAVNMYPVPILTRDIPGYRIFKHTDSLWKGITVQFYLPADNSTPHIGTIFHEVLPNGRKPKKAQIPFSPRLRVRRGGQHMAFSEFGGAGGENARQHSADLLRRRRTVAFCS